MPSNVLPLHLKQTFLHIIWIFTEGEGDGQRYTYRVLQTIQMNLMLLWVWAEWAVLAGAKTALKFKYDI